MVLHENYVAISPAVIKNAINTLEAYPISDCPQLIASKLTAKSEIKLLKAHII